MNILFLSPVVPYPPRDGDRQRAYHLLQALSREHNVHLLCFTRTGHERRHLRELKGMCASVTGVRLSRPRIWWNSACAWFTRAPLNVAGFHSPAMTRHVTHLVQSQGIEVVHAYRLRMAPYALAADVACRVLDYTDALTRYFSHRIQQHHAPWTAAYLRREVKALATFEPGVSKSFQTCLISSPQDQTVLELMGATGLRVVTNGVDAEAMTPAKTLPLTPSLLFVGNCYYPANALGLDDFFRHTWPLLRQALPEISLTLVGSGSQQRRFHHPGVRNLGQVPDLGACLGAARVAIAPLDVASGRQFKVIEYLAAGLPTVTTSLVAENLGAKPNHHLLVADTPQAFSRQVLRLCQDQPLALALREAGRAFILKHYTWSIAETQLKTAYVELVKRSLV